MPVDAFALGGSRALPPLAPDLVHVLDERAADFRLERREQLGFDVERLSPGRVVCAELDAEQPEQMQDFFLVFGLVEASPQDAVEQRLLEPLVELVLGLVVERQDAEVLLGLEGRQFPFQEWFRRVAGAQPRDVFEDQVLQPRIRLEQQLQRKRVGGVRGVVEVRLEDQV